MDGFFGSLNDFLDRHLTPAVKTILLINVLVTLALLILSILQPNLVVLFILFFSENPEFSLKRGFIWQFVTYMFTQLEVWHLFSNMLGLWFFGPPLENRWGTRAFWRFYLVVGVGAGIIHAIVTLATGRHEYVIGASGAIYGILLAFAAYWPDTIIMLNFFIPMKAKYFAILMGFLIFLSAASGHEGQVSNLTHLAGLAVAYVFLSLRHKEWNIRRWQWR